MTPDDRPTPDPIPPLVAWVSHHSGWLILLTILAVVLLEGIGIYYKARREQAPATQVSANKSI